MYCYCNVLPEAIFVVYINFFRGTYLQLISVFMQNFKFGGFGSTQKMKNLKKHVSLYFPDVMSKYIIFGEYIPFCMF